MSYDLKRDLLSVEMEAFGLSPAKYSVVVSYEDESGEYVEKVLGEDQDWSSSWADGGLLQAEVTLTEGVFYLSYLSGAGVIESRFFPVLTIINN